MRINKYISQSGYCSRRQADQLVSAGRVIVNDRVVREMGVQVNPDLDKVRIKDGPEIKLPQRQILLMLHKPKGYVCTKSDPFANRTVYELLPPEYRQLFSVGRLDKDSEGLLLFTNDGELSEQLTHPRFGKAKTYLVTIRGRLNEKEVKRLEEGIRLRAYRAQPATVNEINYNPKEGRATIELILKEGKKRQIREMMLALKHPVKRLLRTAFGPYKLGSLKAGEFSMLKI